MAILLSFDIDSTLDVEDPTRAVTEGWCARTHDLGQLGSQPETRERLGVPPVFFASNLQLGGTRHRSSQMPAILLATETRASKPLIRPASASSASI